MSQSQSVFSQLVDQLDQHLRVINQAAHAPSPAALEDVTREVGPRGLALVEVWKLLWPAIEKNEAWRQTALDRMTRRDPWSAEPFRSMISEILFADLSLLASITKLVSPDRKAEVSNVGTVNESTLIASDEPTEIAEEQTLIAPATIVSPNAVPWSPGFLLAGRYKLLQQIARGGFGEAWLAEDNVANPRRVCVVKKFIFQDPDANVLADIRRRFEKEARALERLGKDHDQIPSLYAFDTGGTEGYFVQEYVEGQNLAEFVQREGPMPEPRVLDFLDSVLGVLSYVHNNKVIHRDIKPANIILRKADGKPVLIDFGALKEIATTALDRFGHATTTLPIGTPGFMPIEQGLGKPRFSTDIYALGFTTIFLLSGKLPRDLLNLATGDVEWSDLASVLSPELRIILGTAIAQMPEGRYGTARLMHDEIHQLRQSRKPKPQIEINRWPRLADIIEGNPNDLLRGKSVGLVIAQNTIKMLATDFGLNVQVHAESDVEYRLIFDDPSLGGQLIISTADDMREEIPAIATIAQRVAERAEETGKRRAIVVSLAREGAIWFPIPDENIPSFQSISLSIVFCSYDREGNVRREHEQQFLPTSLFEKQPTDSQMASLKRTDEESASDEARARKTLGFWIDESEARLESLIAEKLPNEKPSRYSLGTWSVGYLILGDFKILLLKEILALMEKVQGHETGWPPWWVPTREELRPYAYDGVIECWLKDTSFGDSAHSDFWRASNRGLMYLLRGYEEDSTPDRYEPGRTFDLTLPMWRIGECLLHAGRLATELAGPTASILFRVNWKGLRGRTLVSRADRMVYISIKRPSNQDSVSSEMVLMADQITNSLAEVVQRLTAPLYESFDFYSPPMQLISKETARLQKSRV